MIFYFSGTGNSQAVANEIGSYQNERLVSIAQAMKLEQLTYSLESEEKVIFVFPIYAWSPPQLVVDFIKNKKVIEEYIRNQIYEDKMYDQMSMKEFVDPFTGEKIK